MDESMKADCARTPRHDQLLQMVEQLRSVTDHINDVNKRLGVKSIMKSPSACPPPMPMATPVAPVDDLVSVLDMLPSVVGSEIDRIHRAISDLQENLL